jgi:hypothetical protein
MAAMSDYLENKLVDHIFRGISFTAPTTMYLGLLTVAPSDIGDGTEVTGGSYARVANNPLYSTWKGTNNEVTNVPSSGTSGTTSNAGIITFPAPTANWGVVTHFAIYDASSAGNLLFWGALSITKTINNGDSAPSFASSALTIQLDN